jgi:hypothetical protein
MMGTGCCVCIDVSVVFFTNTKQIVHLRYFGFYSGSLFLEVASRFIGSLCRPAVESVLIFSHQSFYSNCLSTCLCARLFYFVLTAVSFISYLPS